MKHRFLILNLGILGLALCAGPALWAQDYCRDIQTWTQGEARVLQLRTPEDRIAQNKTNQALLKTAALGAYLAYAGTVSHREFGRNFNACLTNLDTEDAETFLSVLYKAFFDQAMIQLRASHAPGIQRLVSLIDSKINANSQLLFRLTGHFKSPSPAPYRAGYEMKNASIFIDFFEVPPSEWLVSFIHEMLHALDTDLIASQIEFTSPSRIQKFHDWSNRYSDVQSLPKLQRDELMRWLRAGLNGGFWAEWRAWVVTFALYKEGVQTGLWKPVGRLEEILSLYNGNISFDRFLYDFLDQQGRFSDPTEDVFSCELATSAIRRFRDEFQFSNELPPLGNLGAILAK